MPPTNKNELLYLLNLSLLATHQVDAAYWHEWDVFGVPGGLPFFLLFNFVAVLLLAVGLASVAAHRSEARSWSLVCAGVGLVTVAIHVVFLILDSTAFWSPMSIALFFALGITSILQAALPNPTKPAF